MKLIFTFIFIFSFNSFLFAEEISNILEKSLDSSKTTNLIEEANRLSALGGLKHQNGDFNSAVKLYDKSLIILKSLGMEDDINYANVMFLSAIAFHREGNSCEAFRRMESVISVYKVFAPKETLDMAIEESKTVFKPSCGIALSLK
jgi:hypothetical protein